MAKSEAELNGFCQAFLSISHILIGARLNTSLPTYHKYAVYHNFNSPFLHITELHVFFKYSLPDVEIVFAKHSSIIDTRRTRTVMKHKLASRGVEECWNVTTLSPPS